MANDNLLIEAANQDDLPAVLALLAASELPQDGLVDCLPLILVARQGHNLIGCAALEQYGQAALLRSLAVQPEQRGQGLGRQLAAAALALARQRQVDTVYLLTETAGPFFARHFGFLPLARAAVDPGVQNSVEFTTACPDSAQAMILPLVTAEG